MGWTILLTFYQTEEPTNLLGSFFSLKLHMNICPEGTNTHHTHSRGKVTPSNCILNQAITSVYAHADLLFLFRRASHDSESERNVRGCCLIYQPSFIFNQYMWQTSIERSEISAKILSRCETLTEINCSESVGKTSALG